MKKNFLAVFLLAAVAFAGCSNDDENPGGGKKEKATVLLTVKRSTTPPSSTRAEADRILNNHPLTFEEGYIFFVESGDVIVRYLEMKTGAAPGNDNEIEFSLVSAGSATIENVLTSAEKCYIFSNIPTATKAIIDGMTITEGATKFNDILVLMMELSDLTDTSGGIDNMPQFGVGNVIQPATPGDNLTTQVDVYAMGSRIQIEKITGIDNIVSYKLDGIFVNNYFEEMPVGATLDVDDIINNGSVLSRYDGSYPTEISDYTAGALADITGVEAVPDNGAEVWAYNIWPNESVDAADQADAMPRLVLVFSEVEYQDTPSTTETITGPLFLTVKGMKLTGDPNPITKIQKGNSYTYTNIRFKFSDLTTVPEVDTVDAEVTIEMMDWKDNEVEEIL